MKGPRGAEGSNPLSWQYLAGVFDVSGSLYQKYRPWKGTHPRLRICSYNRDFLEELSRMIDGGTISGEQRGNRVYYRLEVASWALVEEVLERIQPYIRLKRLLIEEWLRNY